MIPAPSQFLASGATSFFLVLTSAAHAAGFLGEERARIFGERAGRWLGGSGAAPASGAAAASEQAAEVFAALRTGQDGSSVMELFRAGAPFADLEDFRRFRAAGADPVRGSFERGDQRIKN